MTESNKVVLRGHIRNIAFSHTINDVDYGKAELIVKRGDVDDVINLVFKKLANPYKDGDYVELVGNVRSYSKQLENGKNSVSIYVFTYFDKPDGNDSTNCVLLSGRLCKKESLITTRSGKDTIHFIVANTIDTKTKNSINSYIPTTAWGLTAKETDKLSVGDLVTIVGELHSRTYKKYVSEDLEIKVAHELLATNVIKANEI